jgi:hypothetical protein
MRSKFEIMAGWKEASVVEEWDGARPGKKNPSE